MHNVMVAFPTMKVSQPGLCTPARITNPKGPCIHTGTQAPVRHSINSADAMETCSLSYEAQTDTEDLETRDDVSPAWNLSDWPNPMAIVGP